MPNLSTLAKTPRRSKPPRPSGAIVIERAKLDVLAGALEQAGREIEALQPEAERGRRSREATKEAAAVRNQSARAWREAFVKMARASRKKRPRLRTNAVAAQIARKTGRGQSTIWKAIRHLWPDES